MTKKTMGSKHRLFWIVAAIGFIVDQLTKFWVVQSFSEEGQTLALLPGIFHFTYTTNTGAAFSLFAGKVEWLRWLSLGVSLMLMAIAIYGPTLRFWEQLGYGFILAGALGNGIDRFLLGYVVDFIDIRLINFAIFNLADVFINIGIACLLITIFQNTPTQRRSR